VFSVPFILVRKCTTSPSESKARRHSVFHITRSGPTGSGTTEYVSMKKMERYLSLALVLMAWALGTQQSNAQIQFDAASSATSGGSSGPTLTWSHTVANQSNRVLIVGVQTEGSSSIQPTSVTYNGAAMTNVGQAEATSSGIFQDVSQWYLIAPAVGTANVVVTWPSAVTDQTAGAIGLYGVAQQSPEASATSFNNSGATTTDITTLTDGAWVVDMFGSGQDLGDLSPGSGQTQRYTQSSSATTSGGGSTKSVASAGATSMTWTQTGINRSAEVASAYAPAQNSPVEQLVQKSSGTASTSSVSATFTSTPTSGNFLIAICGARNVTINQPSGWSTAINESGTPNPSQAIFYKVAGASESSTVTVTTSTTSYLGLQIFEYQNIASVSPVDATNSNSGTGTVITTNSVTTSQSPDLIIVGVTINAATSFSSWTNSFTEQNDFLQTSRTFAGADRIVTSNGAYSTGATAANSAAWRAQIVAFKGTGGLPIQMASSAASVIRDNDVEVTWKTVSETNNYGFEIYRRRSNVGEWTRVGFVEGHGTTLAPQSYSYIDRALSIGQYYYRIKQIDLDGTSEIFPKGTPSEPEMEVTVGLTPGAFVLAQNYPNPFNPTTTIEFTVPRNGPTTIKVYNVLGQEVATVFDGEVEAGKINTVRFDASNFASGLYFYTLRNVGKVETKRMLLLK
jgi:hypothetical protein